MNALFRIRKFLGYQWSAKTKYYLHSPFVYQFYLNVLEGEDDENIRAIHSLRKQLAEDSTAITIEDYGIGNSATLKISDLERQVAVQEKYGKLLYRLVRYFNPESVLELGTSIGISSSYLALAKTSCRLVSLEGSLQLIEQAEKNHSLLGIKNIEFINGNFDESLSTALKQMASVDFVFFDGNHRKEATLNYFNQCLKHSHENSVFIFDDIYWSEEMSEMWKEIKQHPKVTLTIDVFQFGICLFRKEKLAKENFVLRY